MATATQIDRPRRPFGRARVGDAMTAGVIACSPDTPLRAVARKMALHRATYNQWNLGLTSVVIARFDPPGSRADALAVRPGADQHALAGEIGWRQLTLHLGSDHFGLGQASRSFVSAGEKSDARLDDGESALAQLAEI